MQELKQWFKLFRAQTMPATLLLLVTAFLVGGGHLFSIEGVLVCLFALLAHLFSFGENSLLDTTQGFDTKDPSKSSHPLITGEISVESATNVIHTGIILTAFFGIFLAWCCGGKFVFAILSLFLFSLFGEWYNKGNKVTTLSFLPISLCFTALVFYGYFIVATELSLLMMLVAAYVYVRIHFQIDISGNIKDIETGERNMLKKIGAKIETGVFYSGKAKLYGFGLTFMEIVIGLWIYVQYTFTFWTLPFIIFFMGTGVYFVWRLVKKRAWDRDKSLMDMSLVEIAFIYALPVILAPIIGYLEVFVLLIFGVIYFFFTNRLLWESLHPGV